MSIFFNFDDRLNRQPFIILCFALLGIFIAAMVLFFGMLGGFTGYLAGLGISWELPDLRSMNAGLATTLSVVSVTVVLLIFVSLLSLCVRRLHDRDKSGWWLFTYYLVSIILVAMGGYMVLIDFQTVYLTIFAIQCTLSLWFFIDLCLLRGTNGPNLYGADPLTGSVADSVIFGQERHPAF